MAFIKKQGGGDGDVFKFDQEGKQLTGYYVAREEFQGDWGPTIKHTFRQEPSGKTLVVFGSKVLNDLLTEGEIGRLVRVTQTGSKPSKKGNPTKMYSVEVDDQEQLDAAELAGYDEEETDVDNDVAADEIPATRTGAPRRPASAPNAANQAKILNSLSSRKSS